MDQKTLLPDQPRQTAPQENHLVVRIIYPRKKYLFDIDEVSEMLNQSPTITRRFVEEGKLRKCEGLNTKGWCFTEKHIEEFINGLQ